MYECARSLDTLKACQKILYTQAIDHISEILTTHCQVIFHTSAQIVIRSQLILKGEFLLISKGFEESWQKRSKPLLALCCMYVFARWIGLPRIKSHFELSNAILWLGLLGLVIYGLCLDSSMDFGTLSAVVCGIIGSACIAIFIIGGKADNDGQGTNMTWILSWHRL